MSAKEVDIRSLRRILEEKRRKLDQASGRREHILESLKREFNVDSLEGAQKLLNSMEGHIAEMKEKLKKSMRVFQRKYGEFFNEG